MTDKEIEVALEGLPEGICFASDEDRCRLAEVAAVERGAKSARRLLLVINGDGICSGKTRLARWVIGLRYGPHCECSFGRVTPSKLRAAEARGYLWFDDWIGKVECEPITEVLEGKQRVVAVQRGLPANVLSQGLLIVICGNRLQLSPDLLRRVVVVNVIAPGEVGA